jgi:hypothetical protein
LGDLNAAVAALRDHFLQMGTQFLLRLFFHLVPAGNA